MNKTIEAPAVAREYGFTRLVFEDDFDSTDTIDLSGTGEEGFQWYVNRPFGAPTLSAEDFTVENSVLKLHEGNARYNYGLATVDAKSGVGYTFNQGVLEFRVRVPHYDQSMRSSKLPGGGGPAVWSFPREKILDRPPHYAAQWVETDWMEYWGDLDLFPEGHYSITLHETIREKVNGEVTTNRIQGHSLGKERHQNGFHDGEWHTMTFLWAQDLLVGYFDGNEVLRMNYGKDRLCDPLPSVKLGEQMEGAFSFMNEQRLALIISGSKCNPMELDWIRIWQQ